MVTGLVRELLGEVLRAERIRQRRTLREVSARASALGPHGLRPAAFCALARRGRAVREYSVIRSKKLYFVPLPKNGLQS